MYYPYADLFIGDSQTMISEAALWARQYLCNDFVGKWLMDERKEVWFVI